jgi:4-hydroxybenzoate polyprenyltransferase
MPDKIPLCVDLNGALLQTDVLSELVCLAIRKPFTGWKLPFWFLCGRAHLQAKLMASVQLNAHSLPLNEELLGFLKREREQGRQLFLVAGTGVHVGQAVSEKTGLFDAVICNPNGPELSGEKKAALLVERFGKGNFDYAGTSPADLPIWAVARKAIVVNASQTVLRELKKAGQVEAVFSREKTLSMLFRALRPHQWSKNLLIFLPLMGAHCWSDLGKLTQTLTAFGAFCLCASSVYVLNDLLDLESDRHHFKKRYRPFASGRISLVYGLIGAPLLLLASVLVGLELPLSFLATLAIYYALTLLYSFWLKQIEILDVLVLASLYGIRVVAGGYAAQVTVTDWLLAFSMFLFVSLAFVKRFTELQWVRRENRETLKGRGYQTGDAELVSSMGVVSSYLSVLVLAFYITNPAVTQLYHKPAALWLACPVLLYWNSRIWLLAHRKKLHDDPIVFALKDKQSWFIGLILLAIATAASPIKMP